MPSLSQSQSNKMLVFYSTVFFVYVRRPLESCIFERIYTEVSGAKESLFALSCEIDKVSKRRCCCFCCFSNKKELLIKAQQTKERKNGKITFTNGAAILWQKSRCNFYHQHIAIFSALCFVLFESFEVCQRIFPKAARNIYHSQTERIK